MDYSSIFSYMYTEIALIGVIVATLIFDLIAGRRGRRFFQPVACVLMLLVFIISTYATGSGDLAGTLIGVMVPVGVIVTLVSSRYMYKKGWLTEKAAENISADTGSKVSEKTEDSEESAPCKEAETGAECDSCEKAHEDSADAQVCQTKEDGKGGEAK